MKPILEVYPKQDSVEAVLHTLGTMFRDEPERFVQNCFWLPLSQPQSGATSCCILGGCCMLSESVVINTKARHLLDTIAKQRGDGWASRVNDYKGKEAVLDLIKTALATFGIDFDTGEQE